MRRGAWCTKTLPACHAEAHGIFLHCYARCSPTQFQRKIHSAIYIYYKIMLIVWTMFIGGGGGGGAPYNLQEGGGGGVFLK